MKKDKKIILNVDSKLHEEVKTKAKELGLSMNSYIGMILIEKVRRD